MNTHPPRIGAAVSNLKTIFVLAAFSAAVGYAQLTRGFISGTVQDPAGAVIPNAAVKIVQKNTGFERTTNTNTTGLYRFVGVDSGSYTVEFTAPGFQITRLGNIEVGTAQEVTVNQTLAIATSSTVVEVTEAPTGVELSKSTATIERTLPQIFIQNIPLTSGTRDVNQLALLAPTSSRGPGSTGISANGQRARNNNFLLDGIDNNDPSVTIANNRVVPEALQEFQVQIAAYSAEYGRNTGAQIISTTRSGGNAFHGEAYDYHNGNWLQPVTLPNKRAGLTATPRFTQNQVGGDLGGPIKRNKLFFFALFDDNLRREAPSAGNSSSAIIPTQAGYAMLASLPLGPGQSQAARSAALNALGFLPTVYSTYSPFFTNQRNVTVNGVAIPFGTVQIPLANPSDFYYATARVDYQLSTKDTLFFRTSIDKRQQPDVASNLQFGSLFSGGQAIDRQNYVWGDTHVFSPRLTNQFNFAYIRGILDFPENDPKTPSTGITGAFTIGGASNFPQSRTQWEYVYQDVATWQLGRHSLKMGVDMRRLRLLNLAAFDSKGTFTFDNFEDFVNNRPAQVVQALNQATFDAHQTQQNYFVQDDFKVTRNLTLNIGLRYEYQNAPFGFFGATDAPSLGALVPGPVKADKNNWAPRAGFAYSPSFKGGLFGKLFGDGESVIRGGYGMAYDVLFYNILTVNASNFPRVVSLTNTDRNGLANTYPSLTKGQAPTFNPLATWVNSPTNLQNPTSHFYSFALQRKLLREWVVEAGYSGNRAYHGINQGQLNPGVLTDAQAATVVASKNVNSIPSLQARRIYPQFGSRILISSDATSNFNAVYVKADKRLSHGLLLGFNYTFGKILSNNDESLGVGAITAGSPQIPQNYFNFKPEYSVSAFDRTHRYALYFTYQVPWFENGMLANRAVKRAFSGFVITAFTEAQSGQPFTILTGVDTYGNGAGGGARPFYNPGGSITKDPVSGDLRTFVTPLNGTGIVTTTLGSSGLPLANSSAVFGNLGKNTFRGPSFDNQNISFVKKFAITERIGIEVRSDFINVFNHRNFANPTSSMSSLNFGKNTSDPGGRTMLLSGRVRF